MSNVVTLGQRKRRAFLTERVQDVSAYIAWTHDPGPIHRGRRSDRWAPVDGLREELDGAAKKRP